MAASPHSEGHAVPSFEPLEPRLLLTANVVISEFLAINDENLADAEGDYPDWIEIHNKDTQDVNLLGWHLTDNSEEPEKWHFPSVTVPAGGYLVVFASDKDRVINGEIHTSFRLTGNAGGYLALVAPDGSTRTTVFADYPEQEKDVSYGFYDSVTTTSILPDTAGVKVLIPADGSLGTTWTARTGFNDGTWLSGTNGVGFDGFVPGFTVRNYKANIYINDLSQTESVIATPSQQTWVQTATPATVNYRNTGGGAHFGGDLTFPGLVLDQDAEDFAVEATATLTVPAAGLYTFGVNSDDGFRVKITGATTTLVTNSNTPAGSDTFDYNAPRGPGDTFAVYNFPSAGDYNLRLIFYERGGGSEVELFVAPGSKTGWDGTYRLVGDTAGGGLAAKTVPGGGGGASYGNLIKTGTRTSMLGVNATAYIRIPFSVINPASYDNLTLRMKYDDGFVAYLNGTEVARRNAPASPAYNSSATGSHQNTAAVVYEDIDISDHLGLLVSGSNMLAIHGLNATPSDADFLILAELADVNITGTVEHHFASPSPGWANDSAFLAFTGDTTFTRDRGFFSLPFDVSIAADTAGAAIRYTTDGSAPTPTYGTLYTGPIHITTTTALRAVAYRTGYEPSNVDTQTYIFLRDVLTQTGAGFPGTWGSVAADYAMDPDIVGSAAYSGTILNDMKAIPTLSLVMDVDDLFDPATGIYANPGAEGAAWERPVSVEYIKPDSSEGFNLNAGIRIYGGVGRDPSVKRHSFRLLFKDVYGPTKLRYDLFPDSAVDEFNTLILRANFNDAWNNMSWGGGSQYARDMWANRTALAMGLPAPHGVYVHLYINGLYWGLYNPVERPDASFAASYLGGEREDYDAINSDPAYPIQGDSVAWDTTLRIANTGYAQTGYPYNSSALADPAAYQLIQQYVDLVNLADYCMLNFYTENWDWDGHNWYAARKRETGATWKFFTWDTEWVLPGDLYNPNMIGTNNDNRPTRIFQQLRANAEFRTLFADRVYEHLFSDGALTPTANAARYSAATAFIDRAIVGESARWGDLTREPPYTRDGEWVAERNRLLNTYFPQRTAIFLQQLRDAGLYPTLDAPTLNQHGGTIPSQAPYFNLTMSGSGTLYYTLDGTDPRLAGGGVSPAALTYSGPITLTQSKHVKARAYSGGTWSALDQATFVLNTAPPVRITELMYNPGDPAPTPPENAYLKDDFEFVELTNIGSTTLDVTGLRFTSGISFTFPSMTLSAGERVLVVRNQAAFQARYGTGPRIAGVYTDDLANDGERIVLEGAVGGIIHDFEYKDGWYDQTDGTGFSLAVRDSGQALTLWADAAGWRASSPLGGAPGQADPGYNPGAIIINEVLAHTDVSGAPDYGDWIELRNTTGADINLGGWFLSDNPMVLNEYQIPAGTIIPHNGYRVFSQFEHFGAAFALSELGDSVHLTAPAPDGSPGGYRESVHFGAGDREVTFGLYTKSTGGTDFAPMSAKTRGTANAYPLVRPVVINEIMYNPGMVTEDEFIELRNLTAAPVPLYDPAHPENTWRFTEGIAPGGVPFALPAGATIQANGYALVVPIDPATFRARYSVPANVPIWGPYAPGVLSNGGDSIELCRPGEPEPGTGFVPYYRADRVTYSDELPWPTRADGGGSSLMRLTAANYGNDPVNWGAGTSGGTPGALNRGMDVTAPPAPTGLGGTVVSPTQINLTWTAPTDPESPIYYYRVWRNNIDIGFSMATAFSDTKATAGVTYSYQVSAINRDDLQSAKSAAAAVRIVGFTSVTAANLITIQVLYTDTMSRTSAENLANYSVTYPTSQTLPLLGAYLESDNRTVTLTTAAAMNSNVVYTLSVSNVYNTSGARVAPGLTKTFQYAVQGTGMILRQYWTGISGTAVSNLTSSPNYPNSPTGSSQPSLFEAPVTWADDYGTRMYGFVTAPQTGNYRFWIASDDNSDLYLSTDENPANKTRIAWVGGWTNSQEWTREANQQSGLIALQAGRRYYIEALQKESGGGDNLAVGWQLPDGTLERPIPGTRLTPYSAASSTVVSIVATDPSAAELYNNAGSFTVSRTGATTSALTVYYTVAGTARSGDYQQVLSGSVTIPVGQVSASVNVTPVDDSINENDETVSLIIRPGTSYGISGNGLATVTVADNELATVQSVKLNGRSERGPSAIDPSAGGVRTVEIKFREAVAFVADDVEIRKVTFPGGVESLGAVVTPTSVAGSGTDTMTITLPAAAALDTWLKVRLKGSGTLRDLQAHALDGEAKRGGAYIVTSALDLPSGNGVAGGDAVFYVGSLRGDFNGDLSIGPEDKAGFGDAWRAGRLDADFRGVGFGPRPPDGRITIADINGFTSVYQAGVALQRHLDPLSVGGGGQAAGVTPLPAQPLSLPEANVLAEAAGLLSLSRQAPLVFTGQQTSLSSQSDEDAPDAMRIGRLRPAAAGHSRPCFGRRRPVAATDGIRSVVLRL